MHITYENDTKRGPGHGILRCQVGEGERFPEGKCTLALERSSDHFFLGANDWGGQKSFLAVGMERTDAGELQLLLGPDIIDRLDAQEKYRAHVQGSNGILCKPATFCPDGLLVSPAGTTGRVAEATAVQPEAPKPPPPPPPPPEPAPDPPPEEPPVAVPLPEADKPVEKPPSMAGPESRETPPKDRSLLWIVIVALVLLLLLAGAAWYFLKGKKPSPPPEPVPTSTPAQTASPQQAAAPQTTEERVRVFFAGDNRTPPAAAALSRELPKESAADQDAVYRLYYFAGERGESSILMDYAACLDPVKPQWGSIGKDAPAAWDIYEKAKATHPEAGQAQQNLKAWLQQEAASGNAQAVGWLRQLSN